MNSTASASVMTWQDALQSEKEKPYFKDILNFVANERAKGKIIYPEQSNVFNAIKSTHLDKLKVVIIGQDPYHGPEQAHGLCFSVQQGVKPPPSLVNIFKEIQSDLGIPIPKHGCLQHWADQGVLLLNTVLTVEAGLAHSHANKGWETFTDKVIQVVDENCEGVVFLLWGSPAQKKAMLVNPSKHFILKAPHPSPLSAHRGFLGCQHFSKCNQLLIKGAKTPIEWSVS